MNKTRARFLYRSSAYTIEATAAVTTVQCRDAGPVAALQLSSSQKHMCPVPVPSIMHTWSTMNRLICSCDVHVLLMLSYAVCQTQDINNNVIIAYSSYNFWWIDVKCYVINDRTFAKAAEWAVCKFSKKKKIPVLKIQDSAETYVFENVNRAYSKYPSFILLSSMSHVESFGFQRSCSFNTIIQLLYNGICFVVYTTNVCHAHLILIFIWLKYVPPITIFILLNDVQAPCNNLC